MSKHDKFAEELNSAFNHIEYKTYKDAFLDFFQQFAMTEFCNIGEIKMVKDMLRFRMVISSNTLKEHDANSIREIVIVPVIL